MHQLWPALVVGGRAVVVERFVPTGFFAQAARHGATTSAGFAAILRLLLHRGSEADARRSELRHITFAQSLTAEEFADGTSGSGSRSAALGHDRDLRVPPMSPFRRPTAGLDRTSGRGYDVVVRGTDGEPAAPGELGEITVRAAPGATVALGYYRDPEATAGLFREGWLHTGDMATVDANGFFHFVGRRGRHHPPRRHELLGARS
jgi:crotonobetaine/carnitine-CoA ligase